MTSKRIVFPEAKTVAEKKYVIVQFGSVLRSDTNCNPTTFRIRYGKFILSTTVWYAYL